MKTNIFFSIIVPNYNKGKYIADCINSILKQTYKNYEIIVIDDGSTDDSIKELERFNINPLKTNRLQAGGARNLGIENAKGDYVVFLDSDDYLSDEYVLEKLANTINGEDLIFLNYTKNKFGNIKEVQEEITDIATKIEITNNLGAPTKCFKRSLINDIRFPVNKRYEDINFTLGALCKAQSYTYFTHSFFTYRIVLNSNTSSEVTADVMVDILEELVKMYNLCLKYPQYKENILNRLKKEKINTRFEVLTKLLETGENTFKEYFK